MMKTLIKAIAICALLSTTYKAQAVVSVTVDPTQTWHGYMNVFDLGWNFQWGSGWGTQDLCASFTGPELTLSPNKINDPNEYWYIGGGKAGAQGNKIMDANFYVEDTPGMAGETIDFTGMVLANTLVQPYESKAFIKEFSSGWALLNSVSVALTPGAFHLSMGTSAGNHVQYGFETMGPCVWETDWESKGNVKVIAGGGTPPIPEPGTLALFASSAIGLLGLRRKKA